jgi:serine/threonine protein phosphatase PrpC
MLFCGVFDGHGPAGHKVARHVRDTLPSNLSAALKFSRTNRCRCSVDVDFVDDQGDDHDHDDDDDNHNISTGDTIDRLSNANNSRNLSFHSSKKRNLSFPLWEASFVESFKETDEVLGRDSSIDSFCSGSTAVAVVVQVILDTKLKEPDL